MQYTVYSPGARLTTRWTLCWQCRACLLRPAPPAPGCCPLSWRLCCPRPLSSTPCPASRGQCLESSSVQCPGAGRDQCPVSTLWSKVTSSDHIWPHMTSHHPQVKLEVSPRAQVTSWGGATPTWRASCELRDIEHSTFSIFSGKYKYVMGCLNGSVSWFED